MRLIYNFYALICVALLLVPVILVQAIEKEKPSIAPIDRHALVSRHNVILTAYDVNNPLQVGNGEFAFAVDATGLQTFTDDLGTFSDWGWHTFPNPQNYREEETWSYLECGGGRKAPYSCGSSFITNKSANSRAQEAYDWFRRAPHRLHLGRIGFELRKANGQVATAADILKVRQILDLWTGTVNSQFELEGVPIEVITCVHPQKDVVAVQVQSPLLAAGRLSVFWHFPYVEFKNCNPSWDKDNENKHTTDAVLRNDHHVDISRQLDADHYNLSVSWDKGIWISNGSHRFVLTPSRDQESFSFACGFNPRFVGELPSFTETATAAAQHWQEFWQSGGAIDLSASKDPRWYELERRIVLAQYLTAVNSAGSSPPQESGLFSNSWYGKFHLEMTTWHGVHFVLWGRESMVDGWMKWMLSSGLESAIHQAAKQGFSGARWMKMISPDPQWESPSKVGPFRLTQQGHAIYWAELIYRQHPTRTTLNKFKDMVMKSAEFMADLVWWDVKTNRYVLGPAMLSGSEYTSPLTSFNSTVELSYWFYGLRIAQLWRERLGMSHKPKWDEILAKLSKPPVVNGLCADVEPFPEYNGGRPAWLEAYGCMRGDEIDLAAMQCSFDIIWNDMRNKKKWDLWGTDNPMLAMTAARLGRPQDAVNCLLYNTPGNNCQVNGFNTGGSRPYLPASGGLLWAVAMMAAGWDGGPTTPAPGFPQDGTWIVRWEGLNKAQ